MEEQNIPFLKRCSKIFKQILLLIYSCLAGGAGIYYLYLLSFHVKMSFGLTLITGLNFVLISLIGFTVLALRSPDGYKGVSLDIVILIIIKDFKLIFRLILNLLHYMRRATKTVMVIVVSPELN